MSQKHHQGKKGKHQPADNGSPADDHEPEITNQSETQEGTSQNKESGSSAESIGELSEELVGEFEKLKQELDDTRDKYLRLYSEFDNFRKRNAKERIDLIKHANEELMTALLPVLDDFERALKAMEGGQDVGAIVEGVALIHGKFINILEQKGLRAMEIAPGDEFNPELQDAITRIPAPSPELAGKVVDVLEKGYYLNDKVVRFAKVVTGS